MNKNKLITECMASNNEVTISATPGALAELLKLAGMSSGSSAKYSVYDLADSAAEPMEEEYANEPDEQVSDLEDVIMAGDDMHRPKAAFKASAGGDNPMNTMETIWESYQRLKRTIV
jgi:hypothetical protein